MLFNSLGLGDVVEIVLLCALIFLPLGYLFSKYVDRLLFLARSASSFRSNLKDSGSFSEFLKK